MHFLMCEFKYFLYADMKNRVYIYISFYMAWIIIFFFFRIDLCIAINFYTGKELFKYLVGWLVMMCRWSYYPAILIFVVESIFDQVKCQFWYLEAKCNIKLILVKKNYQDYNWNVKSILLLDRINISDQKFDQGHIKNMPFHS